MRFEAQVQVDDGRWYDIEGEGGNIHAYEITYGPRNGLRRRFKTVPQALNAIQEHAGSNVEWDSYKLLRGDDSKYWPDRDDDDNEDEDDEDDEE